MPWIAAYRADLDLVETHYQGTLPPDELRAAIVRTVELGLAHGTKRFLSDCSTLQGGHTVMDLYGLASILQSCGLPPHSCEALIMPNLPVAAADVRFWETICRNRGLEVRAFPDHASALAWLGPVPTKAG